MKLRALKLLIAFLPILLFGYLLWIELVPSGIFVVEKEVRAQSPYLDQWLPAERVSEPLQDAQGDWVVELTGDPVSFFAHPHRGFDQVDVELWFKNHGVPIVEFGGLAQTAGQIYDLHPMQNLVLDALTWNRIEEDGLTLYQRERTYDSISAFQAHPPARSRVATYHANLSAPVVSEEELPNTHVRPSLRGRHELLTSVTGETLALRFVVRDLNQEEGRDEFVVRVFDLSGAPLGGTKLYDDGDSSNRAQEREGRVLLLNQRLPGPGAYRIVLEASDDLIVESLESQTGPLVVRGRMRTFAPSGSEEATVYTDGKYLSAITRSAEGVQEVRIGRERVLLDDPYVRETVSVSEPGLLPLSYQPRDLELVTDGVLAFAEDEWFSPFPVRLLPYTDLDARGVDFVLAAYTPPKQEGDWLIGRASLKTSILVQEEGAWKFALSLPEIDTLGASVDVGKMRVTFRRPPFVINDLWTALRQFFYD